MYETNYLGKKKQYINWKERRSYLGAFNYYSPFPFPQPTKEFNMQHSLFMQITYFGNSSELLEDLFHI